MRTEKIICWIFILCFVYHIFNSFWVHYARGPVYIRLEIANEIRIVDVFAKKWTTVVVGQTDRIGYSVLSATSLLSLNLWSKYPFCPLILTFFFDFQKKCVGFARLADPTVPYSVKQNKIVPKTLIALKKIAKLILWRRYWVKYPAYVLRIYSWIK